MGGSGSGWWGPRSGAKAATDDFLSIDVRELARAGALVAGAKRRVIWSAQGEVIASINIRAEPDRLILQRDGGRKGASHPVELTTTPCHLGGARSWFICPTGECGRRVAILYDVGVFACRECYQLAYPSQRERSLARAIRRADRLCARMGWPPDPSDAERTRPRWMHRRTFDRRCQELDALAARGMAALMDLPGWAQPG